MDGRILIKQPNKTDKIHIWCISMCVMGSLVLSQGDNPSKLMSLFHSPDIG